MKATSPSVTRERQPTLPRSFANRRAMTRFLALSILIVLSAAAAKAIPIFGINSANNNLVRFDSATPGTIVSSLPITGMVGGDIIMGIDFRPVDGRLFGLGSGGRLYVIDPATAVATQVGTGTFAVAFSGTAFGFDFNPVVDRIRVVSNARENLRLDPNTGLIVDGEPGTAGTQLDTDLAYAGGDPNSAATPNIVSAAYTNNIASATTTTLFGLDSVQNVLVRQGGVNGSPNPNAGELFTIGSLGVDPTSAPGFDIATNSGTAFATMVVGGIPRLYTINLSTGAASLVGTIGPGGSPITLRAMTVSISAFTSSKPAASTTATMTGSVGGNTIIFDQSGGLLRHNRFSAGDAGFASDFDFDTTLANDQTLSATNINTTVVVNLGDRDDQVIIGTSAAPASGLAATFQINGQGGGDSLIINDTSTTVARSITLNGASSLIAGLSGSISYGTLESLTINAGSGADTINITGTAAAMTSVNAGDGADTVTFGNGASLSGGLLDGGAGTDLIDYTAYTTPVSLNLTENQMLFHALLTGMQEPGPLSASQASGRGVFVLSADQAQLGFNITYTNLTGSPISGTHFHNQATGVNGPIVRGLFPAEQNGLVTPSGSLSGVWSNSDPTLTPPDPAAPGAPVRPLNAPSPITAGSTLLQELQAGRIYFNIHTLPNFPSGEIRGQLISQGFVGNATGTGAIRGFENATGGSGPDSLTGSGIVNILHGSGGDDVLVGGPGGDQLFGDSNNDRLVWNNGDGSDLMEGGPGTDTVEVNGSPGGDDQFLIQVNPADAARLRFDRTNLGLFNLNIGTTEALDFNTLGGNDTTTVEFAGGNPIPANGIDFDGSAGSDRLVLQRTAGSFVANSTTHTANGPGAGTVNLDGSGITYTGLEPVDDTVPATTFTFFAPLASTQIQVVNGPTVDGVATTQINDGGSGAFELINFARKTDAFINTGSGGQELLINNSVAPPNLNNLIFNLSTANDEINVLAVPPGVITTVNALDGLDPFAVAGPGVSSGATLFLNSNLGFDQLIYDSGGIGIERIAGPNAGQTTITRPGSGTLIYQDFEAVIFDGIARALNISTRLRVLTGDNALIGGFIIPGSENKKVIVRAIGPSLGQFGLTGLLADPTLELYDSLGQLTASNDNWREAQEGEILATGLAPQNELESALIATLAPGAHTVVVRGKDNGTGIGVVEAYDLEADTFAQFANISTRGFVDAGDNVMIGGFILGGDTGTAHVVIRGIGPSLAQVGIPNALADPTLDLYDGNGTRVIFNDNWMDDSAQAAALTSSGLAPSSNEESGIFTILPPGAYTAILAGKNGGIGVGLVEVYNLQ